MMYERVSLTLTSQVLLLGYPAERAEERIDVQV